MMKSCCHFKIDILSCEESLDFPHSYCINAVLFSKALGVSVLQFLIGVKKAKLWFDALQLNYSFQFLIGTIKTFPLSNILFYAEAVSIPYRYYKNFVTFVSNVRM